METPNWVDYFMTLVYVIATKSRDERTHVGAVIVGPEYEIRSTGYNSFPRGLKDNLPDRQVSPNKYMWIEHAERNAIYNAARIGVSLNGCTLYTNGIPCADCARAVIQAGIKKVIVDNEWNKNTSQPQWKKSTTCAMTMFLEADISLGYWDGNLVKPVKYLSGQTLHNS